MSLSFLTLRDPSPRLLRPALAGVGLLTLTGCSGEAYPPSVPIFGSYFPAWILCAIGGVILAVIVRALFIALKLDEHLPVPPLVYLSVAIGGGIVFWFLWSGLL